jgi:hypothetical protein
VYTLVSKGIIVYNIRGKYIGMRIYLLMDKTFFASIPSIFSKHCQKSGPIFTLNNLLYRPDIFGENSNKLAIQTTIKYINDSK